MIEPPEATVVSTQGAAHPGGTLPSGEMLAVPPPDVDVSVIVPEAPTVCSPLEVMSALAPTPVPPVNRMSPLAKGMGRPSVPVASSVCEPVPLTIWATALVPVPPSTAMLPLTTIV